MANYNELNALIDAYIHQNGVQAITGQILNGVLRAMVEQLGRGYSIMGAAQPADDPGTPDGPEAFFATTPGTYPNFGGATVAASEIALLTYDSTDGWQKISLFAGITDAQATVDANVGTPAVTASYQNGVLSFDFRNLKGNTGAAAGFGTIDATVDANIGTPAVSVQTSGPDTAKNMTFEFRNLKGETGVTSVVATVDNTTGNPTCTVSLVGQELHLDFTGLKGAQGDTGVSADYPITIANNLTTNDPTAALSAAQGVVLQGEIDQLEHDVTDLKDVQDAFLIITRALTITKDDFTLSGVYKTTDMTISANANYKSTPIYEVEPGQVFVWANFPTPPAASFCLSQYASDGTPIVVQGLPNNNNRKRFDTLNNLKYTIPTGVYKVGFVWNEGSAPLTNTSAITSGEESISLTQEAKDLLKEELELDEMAGDIQGAVEKADKAQNDIELIVESIPETKKVPSDFTTTGLWKTGVAEIDSSYANYRAIALLDVVEGQVITWHKWQHGPSPFHSVAAIFCYDNDGLPYNGSSARINYDSLTTHNYDTGEFTFKIPSNCSQIGLAYNFNTYPTQEGAEIIISEESVELTDLAKELINNAVETGEQVGDDSAKYYLKGNSNLVYSPAKKLGIIAAGQSNIDGRNSYSDLPAGFVNPNAKVHFCNNTSGTFADFQITDGGANNDWSFDAIVYDLLTKSAYGNQSEIFVMKKTMGGTSIDPLGATNYHWTADYEFLETPSASLLRSFESVVRAGVAASGANFDIKAMLWHQGEGDMQIEQVANRYYENLKNVLAYVRGVVGNPRLHVFCGNISLNRTSPGFVSTINAAYTKLASEDPYLHVVDMSNAALEDGYHFNYQWSIYFGQKVYDLMIDAGIITGTKINPVEPS